MPATGTSHRLAFVVMANEDAAVYRLRRGHWLRVARQRAGLTLKEVAHAMDYSQRSASTIKLWEDGKRDPSDVQLRRLSSVLGIPVEVFTDPDETDHGVRSGGRRGCLGCRASRRPTALP